jgi:hypothetical protein
MEGISSQDSIRTISKTEHDEIITKLISPRIISDYANWNNEREKMKLLHWIESKPLFYFPLTWIFNLVAFISKFNKKL